jgi:hypothetical protein
MSVSTLQCPLVGMGDVTLWYQSFWFKQWACMGLNQRKLLKFAIAYFVYDSIWGKMKNLERNPQNLWEKSKFE